MQVQTEGPGLRNEIQRWTKFFESPMPADLEALLTLSRSPKIFVVPERDLCWDSARKIAGNISELILDPQAPCLSLRG